MAVYVPLPGSKKSLLPNSRPAGPVNPSELASLTVRVRSAGDPKALEKRVYEQAAKPLAKREYLTHEQLAEQHGASKEDLDKVEAFAQQHDLFVVHRSAAARTIELRGKLADLRAAFHTDVAMYHHSTGTYRGRQGEIAVPQELQPIITGVFGFDTRPKQRATTRGRRSTPSGGKTNEASGANRGHKASAKDSAAAAGPGGQNGVASTEFASRYNFPTQSNGTKLDGTGQTIAIIELGGGYRTSDLKVFFNEIGVQMPTVASISVDKAASDPTTADSADGEVMLDIEVAGAVAPNANFAVYFAPNNGDKGFIDAISAAVHDTERKPSAISISWGGPEPAPNTDQMNISAFHEVFVTAAALGITVCVASGDHGTADETSGDWDGKVHVDHPACDDLVLGCGGTQIDNGIDVVWNDGTPLDQGGWASGGGISEIFPVPSYQTAANTIVSVDDGKPGRGVPDIAMSATNYFTRVDRQEGASGGTSAVAPLMAALVTLLNQAKQKNVGFLNPFLYSSVAKGVVHDVTSGTNAITNTVKGYNAGPGWDPCSGLGTPDGTAILNNL
ncbi:MAG: protease pro-enzyme activation domain-containing protein [Mycobacterium sp.]|uniref:S53 family peptidase n=1 Tax=Mycobacterium sp. TaxID=1785 RepID=UPI003F95A754